MELKEKIKHAPMQPGCYLFKDASDRIIYVGKAKVIRNRVKQYFMKTNQQDDKGLLLAKLICDVEFRITGTERDALLEEYRLIKQYRPWFNIQHKKDRLKTYYLTLNRSGLYPSLEISMDKTKSPKDMLGGFKSEGQAREAIVVFNRVFKTPVCSQRFEAVTESCLHYRVGRCLGPCTGGITPEEYEEVLKDITRLMQGKTSQALKEMKKELTLCVRNLEFEKAAVLKQNIDELERLKGRACKIVLPADREVVLAIRAFREESFSLFYLNKGQVMRRCEFDHTVDEEKLRRFLRQTEREVVTESLVTKKCLEDVSVDRKVILLPKDKCMEKRIEYIKKGLLEWI